MQQMNCIDQVAEPEDSREDAECFEKLRAGLIDSYRIEETQLRASGERRRNVGKSLHVSAFKEGAEWVVTRVIAMVEDITRAQSGQ